MATINRVTLKKPVITDGKITRHGNAIDYTGTPGHRIDAAEVVTIVTSSAPGNKVLDLGNTKIVYTGNRG